MTVFNYLHCWLSSLLGFASDLGEGECIVFYLGTHWLQLTLSTLAPKQPLTTRSHATLTPNIIFDCIASV